METWGQRANRYQRDRHGQFKSGPRRGRRRKQPSLIDELIALPRNKARKKLRGMSSGARRKARRELRKRGYSLRKRYLGSCPTCGRARGWGHRCRMKFTRRNAANLNKRLAKQGGIKVNRQDPNIWKHPQRP